MRGGSDRSSPPKKRGSAQGLTAVLREPLILLRPPGRLALCGKVDCRSCMERQQAAGGPPQSVLLSVSIPLKNSPPPAVAAARGPAGPAPQPRTAVGRGSLEGERVGVTHEQVRGRPAPVLRPRPTPGCEILAGPLPGPLSTPPRIHRPFPLGPAPAGARGPGPRVCRVCLSAAGLARLGQPRHRLARRH